MPAPVISELSDLPLASDTLGVYRSKSKEFVDSLAVFQVQINSYIDWFNGEYDEYSISSVSAPPSPPYNNKDDFDSLFIPFTESVNAFVSQFNAARTDLGVDEIGPMPDTPNTSQSKLLFDSNSFSWIGALADLPSAINGLEWPAWTPSNLLNQPKIWLDWDSAIVIVSGAVSEWSNNGTLGSVFAQNTSAYRPIVIESAINGKRAVSFDGIDDSLRGTSAELKDIMRNVADGFVLAVVKKNALQASDTAVFAVSANTTKSRFTVSVGNAGFSDRHAIFATRSDADSETVLRDAVASNTQWNLDYSEINYSARTARHLVNGAVTGSATSWTSAGAATSDTAALLDVSIGCWPSSSAGLSHGNISLAALIVGSGGLPSSNELLRLEGWAAYHCGLQSSLPIDHQYRYTAPYVKTLNLQNNFAALPAVFAFYSVTSGGNTGVAKGTGSDYGTLLSPSPTLTIGQMVRAYSNGGNIVVRLDAITLSAPINAVILDHKGNVQHTISLTDHTTYWEGSTSGSLDVSTVYYVRIQSAIN